MPERVFQTARFKVHNPSRHKQTALLDALKSYHLMTKRLVEAAVADPEMTAHCSTPNKKGDLAPNGYATEKHLRTLTPKGWNLAPVRDYLIQDATAMVMSHLAKAHKGKNESNPPTVSKLEAMTEAEYAEAYTAFALTEDFPLKPEHQERVDTIRLSGQVRVAKRLESVFRSRATTKAAAQLLRKVDGPMPRPIEFRHCEFGRGFLLAKRGSKFYCLLRLFAKESRHYEKRKLEDGFVDLSTGEDLSGKLYPGVILPLEMGREFHEQEYLEQGSAQSAKLLVRQNAAGAHEFYVHIAFEFTPQKIEPETILGLDRGAAKIGSASILDFNGRVVATGLNLDGAAFGREMAAYRKRIADLQRRGIQKSRKFKLRGRRSDAILGEYANALIEFAFEYKSQIVIEKIDGPMMGRFLTQSQFAKLKQLLTYKALRLGLPAPIEIPAARTSQTCSRCGHWSAENRPKRDLEGNAIQDVFRCVLCGFEANADENASIIIGLRGLQQIGNGGKFSKWDVFEPWLKATLGRDGQATVQ